MKKPFLFLSDFDGTMSIEDYYTSFAQGPLKELNRSLLKKYKNHQITSFEYLNTILMNIDLSEPDIEKTIQRLPMDPSLHPLLEEIENQGGDFAVISAGADYYIRPILDRIKPGIPLYANRGIFANRGIAMSFPKEREIQSPLYGIAKEKVLAQLRNRYQTIFFAGDGSGDFRAAKAADIRFAKARLAERLTEVGFPFIPFKNFEDILTYFKVWITTNSISKKRQSD